MKQSIQIRWPYVVSLIFLFISLLTSAVSFYTCHPNDDVIKIIFAQLILFLPETLVQVILVGIPEFASKGGFTFEKNSKPASSEKIIRLMIAAAGIATSAVGLYITALAYNHWQSC